MEYVIIIIFIIIQVSSFFLTYKKIRNLKILYPDTDTTYSLKKVIASDVTISNGSKTTKRPKGFEIIELQKHWRDGFVQIINETNGYLQNNKGGSVNFDIIRDISERKNKEIENSIYSTIAVPLYLGLVATMIGIVIGFFKMDDHIKDLNPEAISLLLGGVKISMIASVMGLLLMIANSAIFFTEAKFQRDRKQNHYYNFIQISLLPVVESDISKSVAKQLSSMANSLVDFNYVFSENNDKFRQSMSEIHSIFDSSTQFIDRLQEIDKTLKPITELYATIESSAAKFDKFSNYQTKLNEVIERSTSSVKEVGRVFNKINTFDDNIASLLSEIKDKIIASNEVIKLVKFHYEGIESVSDYTKVLISNQEEQLRLIYKDFLSFIDENKRLFKDWAIQSVSDAKGEMEILRSNMKSEISNTLDHFRTEVEKLHSNENMNTIKSGVDDLRKSVDSITKREQEKSQNNESLVDAINKFTNSVDKMNQMMARFDPSPTEQKPKSLKAFIKETLFQAIIFGTFFTTIIILMNLIFDIF